ncbi:hypothetical protein [Streptomyces sp. NPDC059468]|uniref:hypothetical protein n=1 Tax=Streptomyces sp. NPDC059468 TaxID=3346845 RepID=UPI0036AFE38D
MSSRPEPPPPEVTWATGCRQSAAGTGPGQAVTGPTTVVGDVAVERSFARREAAA